HGEEIVRAGGSLLVIEGMRQGLSPEEACRKVAQRVLMQLKHRGKDPSKYQACFLALDKQGHYGACSMQPGFTYAVQDTAQGNRLLTAPYVWSKP
ncbi:MAG: glycosylasparaginase, partial [Sphingomonadales bacterium]|nr:glycosylasparaginase [Sphingomonadales bacterium]